MWYCFHSPTQHSPWTNSTSRNSWNKRQDTRVIPHPGLTLPQSKFLASEGRHISSCREVVHEVAWTAGGQEARSLFKKRSYVILLSYVKTRAVPHLGLTLQESKFLTWGGRHISCRKVVHEVAWTAGGREHLYRRPNPPAWSRNTVRN